MIESRLRQRAHEVPSLAWDEAEDYLMHCAAGLGAVPVVGAKLVYTKRGHPPATSLARTV